MKVGGRGLALALAQSARSLWRTLRALSGDDAYDRYLAHWHAQHGEEDSPLTRTQFHQAEQERRFGGVRRCC